MLLVLDSKVNCTLPSSWTETPYHCDRFAWQLVDIHVNFNRSPFTVYKGSIATLKYLRSTLTFVWSWSAFSPGVQISSIAAKAVSHSCWSHSALSCRCVQITIWNQSGNHANQCPACYYQNPWPSIFQWPLFVIQFSFRQGNSFWHEVCWPFLTYLNVVTKLQSGMCLIVDNNANSVSLQC